MKQYEFDVVCLEHRLYKGVIVTAENEEEAHKKAENFEWDECIDEEGLDTIKVESVDMW